MVEVHVHRDSRDRLSSLFARGHSGWAESGDDIVCAAVSAVLQAAWLGLTEVAKIDVRATREGGRLELEWPEETRDDPAVAAIVATAALSVERIAAQYPDHIRVIADRSNG